MQYTTLGRTGLRVSICGLGCGGASRLGLGTGRRECDAIALVHTALDEGITYFDTANDYGTERILAKALKGRSRDAYVLSTKARAVLDDRPLSAAGLVAAVEGSLKALRTDHIDVYHVASVRPGDYLYVRSELASAVVRLKEQGKICAAGISERFDLDTGHQMLSRAVGDGLWDVVMVGLNLLNPSACARVIAPAVARGVGVVAMFAVRRALRSVGELDPVLEQLRSDADGPEDAVPSAEALQSRLVDAGALDLQDAAYRFCRHTPGVDVTLVGTGSAAHLRSNAASILRPPLGAAAHGLLERVFGTVDTVSGQ